MAMRQDSSRRFMRAGIILLAGWALLEIALLQLVAARIGWGALLAFLSIKGGIGLFLIGALMVRGLAAIRADAGQRPGLEMAARAGFGVVSAVLIALPGLLPPLIGIALFTPSLQAAILRRFDPRTKPAPKSASDRNFDLPPDDWREIRRRKPARRIRARKSAESPKPLETEPPAV